MAQTRQVPGYKRLAAWVRQTFSSFTNTIRNTLSKTSQNRAGMPDHKTHTPPHRVMRAHNRAPTPSPSRRRWRRLSRGCSRRTAGCCSRGRSPPRDSAAWSSQTARPARPPATYVVSQLEKDGPDTEGRLGRGGRPAERRKGDDGSAWGSERTGEGRGRAGWCGGRQMFACMIKASVVSGQRG